MNCFIRSCKWNDTDKCRKYVSADAIWEDFKKEGGCAFTWVQTGVLPKKGINYDRDRKEGD